MTRLLPNRLDRVQRRILLVLASGIVAGGLLGVASALVSPWLVAAGLIGLGVAAVFGRSIPATLVGVVAAATVVPFGTLPFKLGITPTFLELATLALFAMIILRNLVTPELPLRWSALGPWVLLLLGFSAFSFLIGSSGRPDSLTAHNYAKLVLSVLLFFGVLNVVRTPQQARWLLRVVLLLGAVAALIGLLLWAAPDAVSVRVLTALAPIGYPDSGRVLRYVEDDPSGIERAIGFAVDPNSFGGLVALLGALALGQALAHQPVLNRRLGWAITGLLALVVVLTQSRAALGGLLVAALFLATVRYRRLWWGIAALAIAGAVLIVGLGKGGAIVGRIVEGLQFRDQANVMRLAEFQNAVAIIREYPIFGVGFGTAPTIDLTTGVSSMYLTLGSRMGLVGLAVYLLMCSAFFILTTRAIRRVSRANADLLIAIQAAILGVLAIGLLDHYFFNIEFPHMAALFWIIVGIGMSLAADVNAAPSI